MSQVPEPTCPITAVGSSGRCNTIWYKAVFKGRVQIQGNWEAFRVVHEEIKVKGQAAVPVDLKFTRHGPVICVEQEKNRAFAVRSDWLEPGTSPYFVSIDYMRAKTFEEFGKAIDRWGVPPINHVYADVQGNIGWAPGGFAPIRPNWDGLLPVPGD